MEKTIWKSSSKTLSCAVLAGIAFAGLAFTSNAYAELAISKQLTTPMTKIEGNKYRVDFSMRVLNTDQTEVSGIVIKDTVKEDLEAVSGVSVVSKHIGEEPKFITVTNGNQISVTSGNLNPNFLDSPEGTILGDAVLQPNEFLVIRYSLDVDFGTNTDVIATRSTVWEGTTQRDISNNGDIPANDPSYPVGKAGDSDTTIYFPRYDGNTYINACEALGGDQFESSYELINNGGFTTKHGTPGQLDTPIAAGETLAGSFKSGALYAGDGAYPHDEPEGAQISIRNDIALHSDTAQQHPFPGDPARPFVKETDSWLFFNGNKTGNPVDVWKQTVALESGKTYNFSMYVSNAAWPDSDGDKHPQIQLFVGGLVGTQIDVDLDSGNDHWMLVQGIFEASIDGDVEMKITNNQTEHFYNNLAITGIALHRCAVASEDSDDDGLTDGEENTLGTNLDVADTDGDGVDDKDESGDSDGDGKIDALESSILDVDGDGTKDQADGDDTDGPLADIDNDGLTNSEEDSLGTDKTKADSDDDEIDDLTEVGGDVEKPKNSDGDCHIDALDSAQLDSDSDGLKDQFDGDSPSCSTTTASSGGGGTTGLGLLAIMALPVIMRRRRTER